MKKLIEISMIIWLLLVATGNSQILKAEKTINVTATSRFIPDVCGSSDKKAVLITFGLGNIEVKDSLYGYNFEVKFDKTKLKFKNGIYVNTLSEFFDTRDIRFDQDSGTASGYCVSMNFNLPPVYGNKELFGMIGEYIGECPDTTYVTMTSIDFTEEFKPKIGTYSSAMVLPIIADSPDRALSVGSPNADCNTSFGKDETVDLNMKLSKGSRADTAEIHIEADRSGLVSFEEVTALGTSVQVDKIEAVNNGIKVKLLLKKDGIDESILRIRLKQISNTDSSLNINLKPLQPESACLCITRYEGSKIAVNIHYKDTTGIGISEGQSAKLRICYDELNESAIVEDFKAEYQSAELYDIRGNMIRKIMWNNIDIRKSINMQGLPSGAYIILLKTDKVTNRSVLIKYL